MTRRRMKLGAALVASLCAVALFAAPAANASHTLVLGQVSTQRDGASVGGRTGSVACPGTSCSVSVPLGGRDYRKFLRATGDNSVTVSVPVGSEVSNIVNIATSGPWSVRISAVLTDSNFATVDNDHGVPVSVTVSAVRQ